MRNLIFLFGLLALSQAEPAAAQAQKFDFIALGDLPYRETDRPALDRLIDRINAAEPAFTIHVGDTKSGSSPCTDAMARRGKAHFDRFAGAVIYTPGDNEWTDCHRDSAGKFNPVERLAFVRALHFAQPTSLGQRPIALRRQGDVMQAYPLYVENARWRHGGVMFVALHVVGSNNNFEARPGAPEEFAARDQANQVWLADSFEVAARERLRGMVIALQADMWDSTIPRDPAKSGFTRTLANLTAQGLAFGRPVLLIHGDSHRLVIDQPLRDVRGRTVRNVTRLQVMGDREVHAVRVTVDAMLPGLFACAPFLVPENPVGPHSQETGTTNCAGVMKR